MWLPHTRYPWGWAGDKMGGSVRTPSPNHRSGWGWGGCRLRGARIGPKGRRFGGDGTWVGDPPPRVPAFGGGDDTPKGLWHPKGWAWGRGKQQVWGEEGATTGGGHP